MATGLGPHLWELRAGKELIQLTLLLVCLATIYVLRDALAPVVVALVLAYLLQPLLSWLERRLHWRRGVSTLVVMLVLVGATLALAAWLVPLALRELLALRAAFGNFEHTGGEAQLVDHAADTLHLSPALVEKTVDQLLEHWRSGAQDAAKHLTDIGPMLETAGVALVFFWYFAVGLPQFRQHLTARRSRDEADRGARLLGDLDDSFAGFFSDRLLSMAITGTLLSLGWWLVGVHYWLLLGVLGGLLNAIPYLSSLAWILTMLLELMEAVVSGGPVSLVSTVVLPTVVYVAVAGLAELVIEPWIESRQRGLAPWTALLAVIIGGAAGGYVGVALAIPLATFLKRLLTRLGTVA